jgi:hypothetical protein
MTEGRPKRANTGRLLLDQLVDPVPAREVVGHDRVAGLMHRVDERRLAGRGLGGGFATAIALSAIRDPRRQPLLFGKPLERMPVLLICRSLSPYGPPLNRSVPLGCGPTVGQAGVVKRSHIETPHHLSLLQPQCTTEIAAGWSPVVSSFGPRTRLPRRSLMRPRGHWDGR